MRIRKISWFSDGFLFFLISLFVNMDALFGPWRPIRVHDIFEDWIGHLKKSAEYLGHFGITTWDPSSLSGNITLTYTTLLHPGAILNLIFPLWFVYSLWSFLACFIAGYGMYLYLTEILRIPKISSYVGSLLFLCVTISTNQLVFVFAYSFPMFLYAFDRYFTADSTQNIKYLVVCLAIMLFSVFHVSIPYFPFIHLILIFYFSRSRQRLYKQLLGWALIWIAYVMIHSPSIYSTIMEGPYSQRTESFIFQTLGASFLSALTSLLREFFFQGRDVNTFNFIPLFLFVVSVFHIKRKNVRFFWLLFAILFSACLFSFTRLGVEFLSSLGLFSKAFSFHRLLIYLFPFIFCVLISYGFRVIETRTSAPSRRFENILIPSIMVLLLLFLFYDLSLTKHFLLRSLWLFPFIIFSIKLFLFYKKPSAFFLKPRDLSMLTIYFLVLYKFLFFLYVIELQTYNGYFNNRLMKHLAQNSDKTAYRTCLLNDADTFSHPAILGFHGFQTADGKFSLYPLRYKHFWTELTEPYLNDHLEWKRYFSAGGDVRVYLMSTPSNPTTSMNVRHFSELQFKMNLLALLNVKYIFSVHPIENPSKHALRLYAEPSNEEIKKDAKYGSLMRAQYSYFAKTYMKNTTLNQAFQSLKEAFHFYFNNSLIFWVYSLDETLPRTFIISNWSSYKNKTDLLDAIGQMSPKELFKTAAFLESDIKDIQLPLQTEDAKGTSNMIQYEPDYIKIKGTSDKPGILILTDTFHRRWSALVNGKAVPILPAYYTLRGIPVPQGKFILELTYKDPFLKWMYGFYLIGIIAIFVISPFIGNTHGHPH